jgi:hypothetical protein
MNPRVCVFNVGVDDDEHERVSYDRDVLRDENARLRRENDALCVELSRVPQCRRARGVV